ncbi:MAG: DUF333 domain-containing protein [Candidatus Devosia phytovorans]|uniref:DUF333 domain-containing protein n=1 Tax=Candidatus Devosia phytovorans TaxID=3121372 RepID=A0AAJ5VTG7_9HYPH|nr:DUF333 domain-containing protein [Devosia sp.]WEK03880.1 MAG: DUF333 domain-containing protein [Devosia sp.]
MIKSMLTALTAIAILSAATPAAFAMSNPASDFCESSGGTVEIVTAANGGELGLCNLPDGSAMEEWSFYRQNAKQDVIVGKDGGDPASIYCEDNGGQVEIVKNGSGAELALCNLPDGTSIEAWSYFRMQ